VLHNFVWHERWTWPDRPAGWRDRAMRLLRFHAGNGGVSIFSNLVVMRALVGSAGLPYLPANLIAIAGTSILNFLIGEFFVFRSRPVRERPAADPG